MNICSKCDQPKPEGRTKPYCVPCTRIYDRERYEAKRPQELARKSGERTRSRHRKQLLLMELAKDGCVDCGEKDFVCLDFDHRNPAEKSFALSSRITQGMSLTKIKEEASKCDVRCSNCHRKRTAKQFGWYEGLNT